MTCKGVSFVPMGCVISFMMSRLNITAYHKTSAETM